MGKNRYMKFVKISEAKFRLLLKCFCLDETAKNGAQITNVHTNTAERIYQKLRKRVAHLAVTETEQYLKGSFEIDESYFGPRRVRGKRGRGAYRKTPVFGILKRDGKVYTQIIKSCSEKELLYIIKGTILENSTIYSDGWKAYDSLIINGYNHYRIYHSHNEFARGKNHINGMESFWSFVKRRINKFNGLTKSNFPLFLKESEFRWNHRHQDLYVLLLKYIRSDPL